MSGTRTRCTLLLETDWQDVVIRYKALCLASGGSTKDCQVGE